MFNAITKSQVEAANYPFATIQPNVGVVEVPDARVDRLTELFHPKKTIYTTFEFTDIAGLVKGASKGEGLGNQFLSNIRLTDAICHVVRCFDDPNITHVEGSVDPIRDIEIINLELIMADLQTVENRLGKVERKAQTNKDKDAVREVSVLKKLQEALLEGKAARSVELDKEELAIVKASSLLTLKPMIYVANMSDEEIMEPEANPLLSGGQSACGGREQYGRADTARRSKRSSAPWTRKKRASFWQSWALRKAVWIRSSRVPITS